MTLEQRAVLEKEAKWLGAASRRIQRMREAAAGDPELLAKVGRVSESLSAMAEDLNEAFRLAQNGALPQ